MTSEEKAAKTLFMVEVQCTAFMRKRVGHEFRRDSEVQIYAEWLYKGNPGCHVQEFVDGGTLKSLVLKQMVEDEILYGMKVRCMKAQYIKVHGSMVHGG